LVTIMLPEEVYKISLHEADQEVPLTHVNMTVFGQFYLFVIERVYEPVRVLGTSPVVTININPVFKFRSCQEKRKKLIVPELQPVYLIHLIGYIR
jgi:hypothetical protein